MCPLWGHKLHASYNWKPGVVVRFPRSNKCEFCHNVHMLFYGEVAWMAPCLQPNNVCLHSNIPSKSICSMLTMHLPSLATFQIQIFLVWEKFKVLLEMLRQSELKEKFLGRRTLLIQVLQNQMANENWSADPLQCLAFKNAVAAIGKNTIKQ